MSLEYFKGQREEQRAYSRAVKVRGGTTVYLAGIGAPVVGDALYGGRSEPGLGRFFLHARSLELVHPSGQKIRVESPLPADLLGALERLNLGQLPPSATTVTVP